MIVFDTQTQDGRTHVPGRSTIRLSVQKHKPLFAQATIRYEVTVKVFILSLAPSLAVLACIESPSAPRVVAISSSAATMHWHTRFTVSVCLLLLSQTWHYTNARLMNITVDDSNPDPVTGNTFLYSPQGYWHVGSNCSECAAQLNPSQIYESTWHDATYLENGPLVEERVVQTALFQFDGEISSLEVSYDLIFSLSLSD